MYDFIVVGAGPAGALLASRLARSKAAPKVLILEAGGKNGSTDTQTMISNRFMTFAMDPHLNYGYKTVPQEFAGRQVDYHRGKGLGGSSAINFAAWTLGPKDDYDEWARIAGDSNLDWENTQRRFKNIESYDINISKQYHKYANPDPKVHGSNGGVHVEIPPVWERDFPDVLDASEGYGWPLNQDINSGDPLGMGMCPSTSRKGKRCTAATAFLTDVPSNLTIIINANVDRVLFEGKKAIGVLANGEHYLAGKEVILSAGALDTPKILMLSGIGDKGELQTHDIDTVQHLPGVGKNLQDHTFTVLMYEQKDSTNDRASFYTDEMAIRQAEEQFKKDGTGPLSIFYNSFLIGFFKQSTLSSSPDFLALPQSTKSHLDKPTVPVYEMIFGCPALLPGADSKSTYITIAIFGMNPQSTGTVRLASSKSTDPPLSDPRLLTHPFDRANNIAAIRTAMDFATTSTLSKDIIAPYLGPTSTSDEDIWAWIKATTGTSWHMSCTVKMGAADDEMTCVDSSFRVKGVEGLRVADMSVTPFLPSAHTVSVAYLVGETAWEKLEKEYELDE